MRRQPISTSLGRLLVCGLALFGAGSARAAEPTSADLRFFESRIRPLLAEKCGACHGPKLQQGKLRVDSREALLRGGARGPSLIAGKPEDSLLMRAVRHTDPALKMPPDHRLPERDITDLEAWIKRGAPWSADVLPNTQHPTPNPQTTHWAFRSPRRPAVPRVPGRKLQPGNPIDAFLQARLAASGLKPAQPADRRTLIRRATFDLTGLPPTPAEIEAFLADRSPDAFRKVVDRLLASPRYGEKWGRHWLDNARYADSNGLDENYHYANAWRYRDYVVEAFNRDLPYNQFLKEQVAGDLLPPSSDPQENYRRLVATGYFLLGPKLLANPDKEQVLADIIDEQIDVTSRGMLGITLSCARCHDHKFDPLSQRDYYAFAGFFRSTRSMINLKDRVWSERPLAPQPEVERFEAHRAALEAKQKALADARKKTGSGDRVAKLEAEVAELERTAPTPVPYALAVSDGQGEDARLFIRGDHNQPAGAVPRGFPALLAGGQQPRLDATRSGRLELAEWITRPENPLTARVIVNRVWQGHFGQGLVRTPDNFGTLGEKPSHPELLDWLAATFVAPKDEAGKSLTRTPKLPHTHTGLDWSLKALHRLIMLSEAYQMASTPAPNPKSAIRDPQSEDPENRLLWRMHRRRLTAEEQRDAMLQIAGELDLKMGGTILHIPNKERVTSDNSSDLAAGVYGSKRRTIYLPVIRNSLYEMLELFDFTDPSAVTAKRSETLSSPQALFLMNHPFMLEVSGAFAASLLKEQKPDAERLGEAYRRVFGRPATGRETTAALSYLDGYAAELKDAPDRRTKAWQSLCHALFCANEFLYVD